MAESDQQDNPLQGYFEWQVMTLLLARDLNEPIEKGDDEAAQQRREQAEQEVSELTLATLPPEYRDDPTRQWGPDIMMGITRATIRRAAELAEA